MDIIWRNLYFNDMIYIFNRGENIMYTYLLAKIPLQNTKAHIKY